MNYSLGPTFSLHPIAILTLLWPSKPTSYCPSKKPLQTSMLRYPISCSQRFFQNCLHACIYHLYFPPATLPSANIDLHNEVASYQANLSPKSMTLLASFSSPLSITQMPTPLMACFYSPYHQRGTGLHDAAFIILTSFADALICSICYATIEISPPLFTSGPIPTRIALSPKITLQLYNPRRYLLKE